MIRNFHIDDLKKFVPNEYSDNPDLHTVFRDDEYFKFTQYTGEDIRALICFKDNGNRDWCGCFFVSKSFTRDNGQELKDFIQHCVNELQPARLWTASQDDIKLNKWHNFLGMSIEKKIDVDGKGFNIWSRIWA